MGRAALEPGQFGENLTIAGLDEAELCIGDRLHIGEAVLEISQPRIPCYKLGIRFNDARMPQRFAASLRCGVYLRVLGEGKIRPGDAVTCLPFDGDRLSVRHLFAAWFQPADAEAMALLHRATALPALSPAWRQQIERRLARRQQ